MNLADIIDKEFGLQEDKFSKIRPIYGNEGQLTVVGWSGKQHGIKFYILKCVNCATDEELYGDGYFRSVKASLKKGCIPYGCSKSVKPNKAQHEIISTRLAERLGYTFIGIFGDYIGCKSKITLRCNKHGDWKSGTIDSLQQGMGCPKCRYDKISEAKTVPDIEMVNEFMKTGKFQKDTVFMRSKRKGKEFSKGVWTVYCPVCTDTSQVSGTSLKKGCVPCSCGTSGQKQAYISVVTDLITNKKFLKFGISNDVKYRQRALNQKKHYSVELDSVYAFSSVEDCKCAETTCKQELNCGVLEAELFKGGWTETVHTEDLSIIKSIFESYGGRLTDDFT